MSASLPIIGDRPAVYTPDGIPLPYYIRADLAYEEVFQFGPRGSGFAGAQLIVQGYAYDQPLEVLLTYTTGATVGVRQFEFRIFDNTGTIVQKVGLSSGIAENQQAFLSWSRSTSTAALLTGLNDVAPLPQLALPPGYSYGVSIINNKLDDSTQGLAITRRRYPTGPPRDYEVSNTPPALLTTQLV